VTGVAIEPVKGFRTDHYAPRHKVLRLSPEVYYGQSLAALGVAAHEAGHALQDAMRHPLLGLRTGLVPMASIGSSLSWLVILAGLTLMAVPSIWGEPVLLLGIGAFSRSDDWTREGAERETSLMAWLTETLHAFDLTWTAVLWGLVGFLGMSIGSIAVVALLLVKLPATHFCDAWNGG
jgi:hypothetical protein